MLHELKLLVMESIGYGAIVTLTQQSELMAYV
jgi:hypothetical protein